MSVLTDLKNEFNNPKWENRMTNEFDYLRNNYDGTVTAWTNTNTYKNVVQSIARIMTHNNISTYKISPASLADTYDGGKFESTTTVAYMENNKLNIYNIHIETTY